MLFIPPGCPTPRYYGEDCCPVVYCPYNCLEGHCNIANGTCLECKVGYSGAFCDEGKYVKNVMIHVRTESLVTEENV